MGMPFKYAAEELRGDREVVMKAVSETWVWLCMYATPGAERGPGDHRSRLGKGSKMEFDFVCEVIVRKVLQPDLSHTDHVPVDRVLYECGNLLDLGPQQVVNSRDPDLGDSQNLKAWALLAA